MPNVARDSQVKCLFSIYVRGQLFDIAWIGVLRLTAKRQQCNLISADERSAQRLHEELFRDLRREHADAVSVSSGCGTLIALRVDSTATGSVGLINAHDSGSSTILLTSLLPVPVFKAPLPGIRMKAANAGGSTLDDESPDNIAFRAPSLSGLSVPAFHSPMVSRSLVISKPGVDPLRASR